MKLLPQRRTIAGSVTAGSQHHELDVTQQPPIHSETPTSSSSSSFSSSATTTGINITTTTTTTTTANTTTNSFSALSIPPSLSQKIGHVMPTYFQTPATSLSSSCSSFLSASEIFRRSTTAEPHPSTVSAVERLFGNPSTQPGVRAPTVSVGGTSLGSRGRRSMHHSWVRPGRTVFSDKETAYKPLASAVASRAAAAAAAAVSAASSDGTLAQNHF